MVKAEMVKPGMVKVEMVTCGFYKISKDGKLVGCATVNVSDDVHFVYFMNMEFELLAHYIFDFAYTLDIAEFERLSAGLFLLARR